MVDLTEYIGCLDGGCIFGHPGGMQTNGGCRCFMRHKMTLSERRELTDKIRKMTAQKDEYKRLYEATLTKPVVKPLTHACATCQIMLMDSELIFCDQCEENMEKDHNA